MPAPTLDQLAAQAAEIRDETLAEANSQLRVGTHLLGVVDYLRDRDAQPPGAALTVAGGLTQRRVGSSAAVTLSYVATRRTFPLASITVDGTSITPSPGLTPGQTQSGTVNRTANNASTTAQAYVLSVTDANGTTTTASVTITYLYERFFFATATDLLRAAADGGEADEDITDLLNALPSGSRELAAGRQMTKSLTATAQRLTWAYRASFGTGPIYVNGVVNTAFGTRTIDYINPDGVAESYLIVQGTSVTTGTYSANQQ